MKILTVIQARLGSSRLPGKVMMQLQGAPLLARMVERVERARLCGTTVVATTLEPSDDVIASICHARGWLCYRGNTNDLLDRHYQAAKMYEADVVIKIPSDCPLIDPSVIDQIIQYYLDHSYDYVSNLHPATFPDGNDVEIMSIATLHSAWLEASRPLEREHTTPYIWENPEKFTIGNVAWDTGLDYSMSHRFTIDYLADFEFINAVYDHLYPINPRFSLQDIIALTDARPDIFALNHQYAGVNWYRNHLSELKTVGKEQTRQI